MSEQYVDSLTISTVHIKHSVGITFPAVWCSRAECRNGTWSKLPDLPSTAIQDIFSLSWPSVYCDSDSGFQRVMPRLASEPWMGNTLSRGWTFCGNKLWPGSTNTPIPPHLAHSGAQKSVSISTWIEGLSFPKVRCTCIRKLRRIMIIKFYQSRIVVAFIRDQSSQTYW